jgi:hypothetical protein
MPIEEAYLRAIQCVLSPMLQIWNDKAVDLVMHRDGYLFILILTGQVQYDRGTAS